MFDSKAKFRKQQYKMAIDTTAARRMRGENMVEIRKSKREESLRKKRREVVASAPNCDLDEKNLSATVFALAHDDLQTKEAAVIHLRNMLSIGGAPPIDMVIQSGVVPLLIDILKRGDMPQLQFEAAWSLTNIVAGTSEHAKVVIDSGALPIFIELLSSENDNVREQVVWALGNIAGDSPDYRDLALAHGALRPVIAQFNENARFSMVRNAAWTLSNLCRGKPLPPFELVKDAFPMLGCLIRMEDEEILTNTCWALSDLTDTDSPSLKIQEIIDAGIFPKLVELLSHPSWLVVIPVLRTVGNIASGDDVQTQFVIDNQVLPPIFHLLTTQQTKKNIIREACWAISNITAGTKEQVQAVINAQIFPPLISLLANAQLDIKREAAWAVSNATSAGSNEQIRYIASQGCIDPLCDLLACQDPRIIIVCLEGLANIMRAGTIERNAGLADVNIYAQLIQDKVNDMQLHESTEVSENSINVLDTYFAEEDDDDIPWSDTLQTACGFNTDQLPQVPPGGFNFM